MNKVVIGSSQYGYLFLPAAFVVFRAMTLPISEAHPTEVVLARVALHVVAAAIFLYAYAAFWTLKRKYSLYISFTLAKYVKICITSA